MKVTETVGSTLKKLTYVNSLVDHVCFWGQPHNEAQIIFKKHVTTSLMDIKALKDLFDSRSAEFRKAPSGTISLWLRY